MSGNPMTATAKLCISIITPSRNGAQFIAEAVESVRNQGVSGIEHIVMDACSTDGTLPVLSGYPEVMVISAPDHGSHDAMNKGLARATGDIIGFLNVDDFYLPGVFDAVIEAFQNPEVDVVVGRTLVFAEVRGGKEIRFVRSHEKGHGLWLPELALGAPAINGCFFRRRVFERLGNFDNDYDFAADRHFLIRLAIAKVKSTWLDRTVLCYRLHDDSRTFNPNMRNILALHREYLTMSWELAGRVRGSQHRLLLAWHAIEGAKLVVRCALRKLWRESMATLVAMTRRDPLWVLRLPQAVVSLIKVRLLDRRTKRASPTWLSDLQF